MKQEIQLTHLYCTVCRHYNTTLAAEVQRQSNNSRPKFTDEECITIYLFGIAEGKFEVKAIHQFIKDYWGEWFPDLPSYEKFAKRVNFLAPAFATLFGLLVSEGALHESHRDHLMDSMPIIVANGRRSGGARAAYGLCDKGYCSSKGMYYYGVKLHVLCQKRYETLPAVRMTYVEAASQSDITVAKSWLQQVRDIDIYADKIYANRAWSQGLALRDVRIFTPIKKKRGQAFLDSADALYSAAISRTRQAIESFFNWIQEKTHIQFASKVRSVDGLIAFIFS